MEVVEKKYRDTPKSSKKYAKRLTDYISFLMSKGRNLEAKHFFRILQEAKPTHAETIRLGYSLSIATFDNEGVKVFDKLLYDSKPSEIEICWFRLKYYLSVNDYQSCEETCVCLLSKRLENDHLNTIYEACIYLKSYVIAQNLLKYLKKEDLMFKDVGTRKIKKIIIQKLVDVLGVANLG